MSRGDLEAERRRGELKEKIQGFPKQPGVYIMKNAEEKVLYVGKAKSLRSRVMSYLSEAKDVAPKVRFLMSHVVEIEYVLTETEVEAFLVEASLIKKFRPKYNIRLKDDKSYPYLRLSLSDEFPRLYLSRKINNDGAMYFGPYTSGQAVRGTMKFLNESFKIRDCRDAVMRARTRPCLTYQIQRCDAPCVGFVQADQYKQGVDSVVNFLTGKDQMVCEELESKMLAEADGERFENAARIRDSLQAIRKILESQMQVSDRSDSMFDTVLYRTDPMGTLILQQFVRAGRVLGKKTHYISRFDGSAKTENPQEWLISYLNQYYTDNVIPELLLFEEDLGPDMNRLFSTVLKQRKGTDVQVRAHLTPEEKALLDRGGEEAVQELNRCLKKSVDRTEALRNLQERFGTRTLPLRIECYDISNFQGSENVASMTVLEDGELAPHEYKKFKIKTFDGQNDFESLSEVFRRRFAHTDWPEPDLIVVDGGKGQLSSCVRALKSLDLKSNADPSDASQATEIPFAIVSLAKARTVANFQGSEVDGSEERFFIPGRANPIKLSKFSEEYRMLVSLRDEAHRFAITYHRMLREKGLFRSVLDDIPGIGPERKKMLLKHFEGLQGLQRATVEELSALEGITPEIADKIVEKLKGVSGSGA